MSDKLDFAGLKASGLLPSPKGVALTIMHLCQKENFSLPELAHAIQADPVLAGRIIKVANAANPNKSRPIASVTIDTLILIGIHAVRQVTLSFSLINSYQKGACRAFNFQRYWSRSVAMASAAQAIGSLLRIAPPAELFTCGLLADIGRLGIATAHPGAYSDMLSELAQASAGELNAAERNRFGMSHCDLGAEMMADWGIPRLFIDAVLFHEHPETSGFAEGSRQCKLTYTLQLAALIADACLENERARDRLMPGTFQTADILDLKNEQVIDIANQVLNEWYDWGCLLKIPTYRRSAFQLPENIENSSTLTETENLQPVAHSLRILLAGDDDALTIMVEKLLGVSGHTVFTARNSRQAYEIAQREQPHVIIADWGMPETDGLAFCRTVRGQSWGGNIYFMILAVLEDEHCQIEAFEAGVDLYMKKPFNTRLLNAKLLAAQRRFNHAG